ncbi:MAG: GGDEF domain-containing protein [Rickettsiales bacterium]
MEKDEKHTLAQQALALIDQHKLSPNPENYAIWFHYVQGKNQALIREIDTIIDGGIEFGEDNTSYLYNKYILSNIHEKKIENVAAGTQNILQEVQQMVTEFSGETTNYNKGIDKALSDISTNLEEGNVKSIVQTLVETTKVLKENGAQMSRKLHESNEEINKLKSNLKQTALEAQRDFLTGVYNRKTFEQFYDDYAQVANDEKSDLCFIIIDIDHFKQFNDKFGHLIGDEVLKIVAKTLTDSLKGRDIVGRFGGEEFVVLLPDTPIDIAMKVADSVRVAISSKELKHKGTGENYGTINVSMGVAAFRHDKDTLPTITKRADDALYKSKENGRNRVTQEAA